MFLPWFYIFVSTNIVFYDVLILYGRDLNILCYGSHFL